MKALMIRAQYMVWSLQKFPRVAARCLRMLIDEEFIPATIDDEVLNQILRGSAALQGQAPAHDFNIIVIIAVLICVSFTRRFRI